MATQQEIEIILKNDVQGISTDVTGSIVIDILNGLPIASDLPPEQKDDHIAGVVATFLGSAEILSEVLSQELKQASIESGKEYIIINNISKDVALAIIANEKVKVGLIRYWLKEKIVPKLERLLK
jgi:predicted regulator of Ras-like GTPase activity (Roadblock/LC7/MglB family)